MLCLLSGQLEQERNINSGKLDLMIDGDQYYILVSTEVFLTSLLIGGIIVKSFSSYRRC